MHAGQTKTSLFRGLSGMYSNWMRLRSILTQERHPLLFLTSRLLMLTPWSKYFSVRRNGYTLSFFPTSLSAAMWADADFRTDEERFLRGLLRPGDVVIDVGANIGNIAIASAVVVGSEGRVLAVEPHPRIFTYLKANIARNGAHQIEPVQCALGHEEGTTHFSDRRSDDQNAITSDGNIEVPLRRLDEIAPAGKIVLLKVDVEGHEYFVFRGAEDTLRRTEVVYFEYVPRLAEVSGTALPWQPLLDQGFHIYEMRQDTLRLATLPPKLETMLIASKNIEFLLKRTGRDFLDDNPDGGSNRGLT
jgi:FkbM family methyltransferase